MPEFRLSKKGKIKLALDAYRKVALSMTAWCGGVLRAIGIVMLSAFCLLEFLSAGLRFKEDHERIK